MESVGVSTAKALARLAFSLPLYSLSPLRVSNVNFERKRIKMKSLSNKQNLVLAARLSCLTRSEAALWAGVSRTTLWRYERKLEFQAAYREKIAKIVKPLIPAMGHLYLTAIKRACKLLDSKSNKVQLAAIEIILVHILPGYSKKK